MIILKDFTGKISVLFFTATDMFDIFHYSFMVRAFIAGVAIAVTAPMIGTFLVMRRFSLFADSLSHVALAGVAIGIICGWYPVATAVVACVVAAIFIEKLRSEQKIYGDAALSLFLSGSLAIALVLISLAHGFNVNLFSYLFGSVAAVEQTDVYIILGLTVVVLITLLGYYRQLFYISFDEEAAKVSGVHVKTMNLILMTLAAVTVALSMRIVGILMVGALMVIPVLAALQISKSFLRTLFYSVIFSVTAVVVGLVLSYQYDIIAGGAIVLLALMIFILMLFVGKLRKTS